MVAGNMVQFKAFLDQGRDINEHDEGFTPLIFAAWTGNTEIARFLIENGADVNRSDSTGFTPLHAAARMGKKDCAQFLIQQGAVVNARNGHRATPLHLAAAKGHAGVVQLLLGSGAAIGLRDQLGFTSFDFASTLGHEENAELLSEVIQERARAAQILRTLNEQSFLQGKAMDGIVSGYLTGQ